MKLLTTLSAAALTLAGFAAEVTATPYDVNSQAQFGINSGTQDGSYVEARRGRGGDDDSRDDRGRGRGGDRSRSDDAPGSRSDDSRGGGRSRPRIPGGSGCDSAHDIAEHPECSMPIDSNSNGIDDRLENGSGTKSPSGSGRSRPRVPGGSGCDSPRDLIEHPECSA